jgi:hypothetical protein
MFHTGGVSECKIELFTMDLTDGPFVHISNREMEKGADNKVVQKKKPGFCFLTVKVLSNNQAFPHIVKLCKSGGSRGYKSSACQLCG